MPVVANFVIGNCQFAGIVDLAGRLKQSFWLTVAVLADPVAQTGSNRGHDLPLVPEFSEFSLTSHHRFRLVCFFADPFRMSPICVAVAQTVTLFANRLSLLFLLLKYISDSLCLPGEVLIAKVEHLVVTLFLFSPDGG